jgi:rod shape-determining protein MreD
VSRYGQTLEPWRWIGLPALGCLAATVALAAPFRVFGFGFPEPVFALAPAFAWAVIRPSLLGPVTLFVLGLFCDLFWGGPLGLWALSLIAAYGLALGGRSLMAGQGGAVMAAWYLAACVLAFGVAYILAIILAHEQANLIAVAWQFLWTAALYPIVHWLTDRYEDADVRFR